MKVINKIGVRTEKKAYQVGDVICDKGDYYLVIELSEKYALLDLDDCRILTPKDTLEGLYDLYHNDEEIVADAEITLIGRK